MVIELLLMAILSADTVWEQDDLLQEQVRDAGSEGSGIESAEWLDPPSDPARASPFEISRLPGMSFLKALDFVNKRDSLASSSGMMSHPPRITFRVRTTRRWGDNPPTSTLGPAFSSRERVEFTQDSWRAGLLLDRDRYEPRWDDLRREWIEFAGRGATIIAGDFTAEAGEGLTFRAQPAYFDLDGAATSSGGETPRIAPAVGSSVNSSLFGAGVTGKIGRWNLMATGARTRLDATIGPDGNPLTLSDGGLHRTIGEAEKKNSVREDLLGAAIQHDFGFSGVKACLGVAGWKGIYSPGFEPSVTESDPFPLRGSKAGSYGVWARIEREGKRLSGETSWDLGGTPAALIRGSIVSHDRNLALRLIGYHFPADYTNPHSRKIEGKEAANLQGAALAVEGRMPRSIVEQVSLAGGVEERLWRTRDLHAPPSYGHGSVEVSFREWAGWSSDLRLSRREGGDDSAAIVPETTDRVRWKVSGVDLAASPTLWIEQVTRSLPGQHASGWVVSGSIGSNYRHSFGTLNGTVGIDLFDAPSPASVYSADVCYPDVGVPVRLSGRGERFWGSLRLESGGWWLAVAGSFLSGRVRSPVLVSGESGGKAGAAALYLTLGRK